MQFLPQIINRLKISVFLLCCYLLTAMYEIISVLGVRDFHEISNYSLTCVISIFLLLGWWFTGFCKTHFLSFHLIVSWLLLLVIAECFYFSLLAYESMFLGFINSLYVRAPAQDPFTGIVVIFFGFVSWGFLLWTRGHLSGLLSFCTFFAWLYIFWGLLSFPCFSLTLFLTWYIGTNYFYFRVYDPFFSMRYRRRLIWRERKLFFRIKLLWLFTQDVHRRAQIFERLITKAGKQNERKIHKINLWRQYMFGTPEVTIFVPEVLHHFWYHRGEETDFDVIFDPVADHEINKRPLFDREYWGFGRAGDTDEEEQPTSVF